MKVVQLNQPYLPSEGTFKDNKIQKYVVLSYFRTEVLPYFRILIYFRTRAGLQLHELLLSSQPCMICCSCTSGSTFVLCAVHVKIQYCRQILYRQILYTYCTCTTTVPSKILSYFRTEVRKYFRTSGSTFVRKYFRTSVLLYYLRWYESTFVLSYQLVVRVYSCTRNRYIRKQLSSSMQLKVQRTLRIYFRTKVRKYNVHSRIVVL